jgi:hypothetical protein
LFDRFAGSLKESHAQITFTEEPKDTTAISGKTVYLNCTATAPRKIRYLWYFETSKISFDARVFVQDDGTLQITNVDKNDAGEYHCAASFRDGNTRKRITIKSRNAVVKVQGK